jgi:hypothetical protein
MKSMFGGSAVWSQTVGFVLGRSAGIWLQSPFSHLIYLKYKFHKVCAFSPICRDNPATDCIAV